jgi:hypothetical protein
MWQHLSGNSTVRPLRILVGATAALYVDPPLYEIRVVASTCPPRARIYVTKISDIFQTFPDNAGRLDGARKGLIKKK